jgi:hypothetical protein
VTAIAGNLDDVLVRGVSAVITAIFVVIAYRTPASIVGTFIIIRHFLTSLCSG